MSKLLFIYLTTPSNQYCCILLKSGVALTKKKAHSSNCSIERVYSNLLYEKPLKFCKLILRLDKSTTNFAVLSELGKFPPHFNNLTKKHAKLQAQP